MDNLAAILAAVALLGAFGLLVAAIARGSRRLLGNDRALIDAVKACASCAARPVCETGALAGWPGHPAVCPNVARLRRPTQPGAHIYVPAHPHSHRRLGARR